MPPYLTHAELWKSIWPIIAIVVLLAFAAALLVCKKNKTSEDIKKQKREIFLVVLAFSSLGMVTGYLTGFSRESVVGAVLPAVLSLMGGLMIFLIGKSKESREIVSISMFIFSITLLLGTGWGSVMRGVSEAYSTSEIRLKQQAYIESEVNEFRLNLGLQPLITKVADE